MLGWEFFFTLFKFICSYITKPTTPNDANFALDEHHNFSTEFSVKFTTSVPSSQYDLQLRNEIAKFIANLGNFKWTSETICQKFCEMLCKMTVINASAAVTLLEQRPEKLQSLSGIRTHDLCDASAVLSQLSYQSHMRAVVP